MTATNKELGAYIVMFSSYVALMHTIDGPWNKWAKRSGIDAWTLTHIIWGYIGAKMNQSFTQQVTLASINELIEVYMRKYHPGLTWSTLEPGWNVPIDIVANAAGWRLAKD